MCLEQLCDGPLVVFGNLPADRVANRAPCGVQRFEVFQQPVGGSGSVHPDEDLGRRGAGDLREGVGEHGDVVSHRVRSGIPRLQEHGARDSVVFAHHAASG
ncbi:hypothetical protein [Streptomyces sp. Tue6028]|uniref:hypothetical protein n=1 Tax=Streptomyces sp. Tue6028 TaxID=2036037 RepID=UPI003D713BDD